MPVAIDSLLPNLWPGLQSGLSLMELWATWEFDEQRPVWVDALGGGDESFLDAWLEGTYGGL
jgi:hypothetical protein